MSSPTESLRAITAKTDQSGQTTNTMSLIQHGRDSAAVMGWLWDNWLPPITRRRLSQHFESALEDGGPGQSHDTEHPENLARTYAQWIASVHDCGKTSMAFQLNLTRQGDLYGVRSRLERAGLEFPPGGIPGQQAPHCRIGQGVLTRWLQQRFPEQSSEATSVAALVGAHHGVAALLTDVQALPRDRYANVSASSARDVPWMAAQDEFLDLMTTELGAVPTIELALTRPLPPALQVALAGLIVVADWLASDADRFPYAEDPAMKQRLRDAELGADILPPWRPVLPSPEENLLATRFDFAAGVRPNSGQQALIDAARTVEAPSLLVLEAPTGSGKTEAALMAAEILAARFGCGGLEFLLPTRGTTDGLWERLTPWIEQLPAQGRQSVSLAHGKAGLNENFMEMTRRSRFAGVASDGADAALGSNSCDAATQAWVSAWFSGRRKATLASMVAGTIDQLLLAALQTRHVALRHTGLAGKVVVIDECHAADEYMLVYLERALRWLGAHGVPTIAMSATLPDATRKRLVEAYTGKGRSPEHDPAPIRLTTAGPAGVHSSAPPLTARNRYVTPTFIGKDEETITARCVEAVDVGACVAVIRNTVGEAQETYRTLREELGADRVQLLHSRFLGVHRAAREQELRRVLGPGSNERPGGFAIVATQVLEVSLDIDVDLMISDIAPVDVLFQRAGRLHRHQRGTDESERPADYRTARLFISGCTTPDDESTPEINRGSAAVYGEYRLLRAMAALLPWIDVPVGLDVVPRLVQEAYLEDDEPGPDSWREAVWAAEDAHNAKITDQAQRAAAFVLPRPNGDFTSLSDLMPHRSSEADNEARAAAQVRDAEDSIEVIAVRVDSYDAYLLTGTVRGEDIDEAAPIPIELEPPSHAQARLLARCTVTLPPRLTRYGIDDTLHELERASSRFTSWQLNPLLKGELVLPLDDCGEITVCDVRLRYDYDLGLMEVSNNAEAE